MKSSPILTKVILLLITTLFIGGCDKDEDIVTYDLTGDWKVISFEDYATSTKITKTDDITWTQFNAGDNTISFIKSDLTSGVINGINVTNSFSGNYVIDLKGGIVISDGIWTMVNEPQWGRLFHSIVNAETYEIRNGRLIIYYNQKKNSITLERYYNTPTVNV